MSEFLGSRISLISRSDIRYVGTLHQINSDDSTVSLENVTSFGTEGRKGNPDEEVPPSDQVYEYIVFRGTDVKDLKIEEAGPVAKEKPPAVPNDPAIVGARPRPGNIAPGPPGPSGPPGHPAHHVPNPQVGPPVGAPGFGYYPPNVPGWGRAGPPGPNPNDFGCLPGQYPPPQWYGGQQFHPMGQGPWNNYPYPPGVGGPPGAPTGPGQIGRQSANQTPNNQSQPPKPAPIGPAADRKPKTPAQQPLAQPNVPTEATAPSQPPKPPVTAAAPAPPVESKPSVAEVKATTASLTGTTVAGTQAPVKTIPTGPKGGRPGQIFPAVPLPAALTARAPQQSVASSSSQAANQNSAVIHDATQAAKAAVAVAMAKLEESNAILQQSNGGNAVDNLTKKVNDMRVSAARSGQQPNRGGRGRGPRPGKVEVPDSDFDFASANAKFNKQDVVKEAIAGSPLGETTNPGSSTPEMALEAVATGAPPAYNKARSFFDNISSEAKDRAENGQKPGGREWRGEEQRKNMETFGQGSVDGAYRGYRGRGRGRGGRGRGYRGGRGNNASGGFYPRDGQTTNQ
ncbi:Scd6-like Sm domain-containing protein [Echria macrotheca]|uniref:Scd6-like Sm domain-containing protein n=1 Tax=Echria macrotheca TaxID=438768 RepID=A0AAJ0FAC1_9PEZI|nr:Scd6-like Sm domain-containing protein [Echria macrotheca]